MEISIFLHELFRILNFVLFSGGAAWLFYKKIYPSIKQKMFEKYDLEKRLKDHKERIIHQQKLELDERECQEQRIEELLRLVNQWRAQVEQKQKEQQQQIKADIQAMQQRYEKQQTIYIHEKMLEQKLPKIFENAQKALEKKYEDPEQAKHVLQRIIQTMKL